MSARGMLTVVGSAVGAVIGWNAPPPADPAVVRALLAEIGRPAGETDDELTTAVRAFQARAGLTTDGVAGPRTVHVLNRYAMDRRAWQRDLAA
ncbi:peptidoglycan-binding domain-containing protein [Actinoplanes sp. M2I2]|uniref:peptidoglycan-binding protein n=1 Tax=Actinoplanes sp. M2I2 TaxID=1734444 RepID=UPI0024C36CD6|nr:peptidoglycan-binding domain-containing protein [Actinoplanes sp. M2I2]